MLAPQRLELVLSATPVPQTDQLRSMVRQRMRDGGSAAKSKFDAPATERGTLLADASTDAAADAANQLPVKAIRGAFELRPQLKRDPATNLLEPETLVGGAPLWELWWIPLPPKNDTLIDPTDAKAVEAAARERQTAMASGAVGDPYKVASNLAFVEWRMFQGRARQRQFEAAYWSDLPAYVEMEVETADGLTGNWLFEVSADQGAEVPPSDTAGAGGKGKDGDASKAAATTGLTSLTPAQPPAGSGGAKGGEK